MSVIATAVKHLIAAGVTGDALVTAIADMESSMLPARSKAAERTARWRSRKEQTSQNVTKRHTVTDDENKKGLDKEKVAPKEINLKNNYIYNIQRARETVGAVSKSILEISEILPDDAKSCHDAVQNKLSADGFAVEREVGTVSGGFDGRFDLVVWSPAGNVAIEIDRRQARARSVQKLLGFDGGRIQVLRGTLPEHPIFGIDAFIALNVESGAREPSSKPLAFPDDFSPNEATASVIAELGISTPQVKTEIQAMRDWSVNAGPNGRKRDWQAFARNWFRKSHPQTFKTSNVSQLRTQKSNTFADVFERQRDHLANRSVEAND